MKATLKTTLFIASTAIAMLAMQYCRDPEPSYRYVSQERKDWGAFKPGTWWVYEEETLKIRDSVYVYAQKAEFVKLYRRNPLSSEQEIKSFMTTINLKDSFYYRVVSYARGAKLQRLFDKYPELESSCYLVAPPPVKGDWLRNGPPEQITYFDTIYPTLKLGNLEFQNVVRANDNMNLAYDGTPTLFYSARHIGIVRKEFPEFNLIWNLVAYNIVQ